MYSKTLPELLESRVRQSPEGVAHWTLDSMGRWQPTTWVKYHRSVLHIATGLQDIGLSQGQHIGIMATTSQTWEYLQMAILISGGVVVGIAPHDLDENINEIANRAELVGLVVQNPSLLSKISPQVRNNLNFIVSVENPAQGKEVKKLVRLTDLKKTKSQDSSGSSSN